MEYRLHRTSSHIIGIKERNLSSSKNQVTKDESLCSLSRTRSLPTNTQTTMPTKTSHTKENGGGNVIRTRGRFAVMPPGNFKLVPFPPPPSPSSNIVPNSTTPSSSRCSSNTSNSIRRSSSEIPWTTLLIHQMEQVLKTSLAQHDQLVTVIRAIDPDFNYDSKSLETSLRTNNISESVSAREYELLRTISNLQGKLASLANEVQSWRSKNSRLENQLYTLQFTSKVDADA